MRNPIYHTVIILYSILIMASVTYASSIDTIYVYSDSLKEGSISLDNVWKYHSGNDSVWANTDYDDSNWDTLRTRMLSSDTPKELWKGIGWFRTRIKIDSSLINMPIAFLMNQLGASEIYLNGKLIKKMGAVGDISEKETPYQPLNIPFIVTLDSSLIYTIAVLYSNKRAYEEFEWFTSQFSSIGFELSLRDNSDAIINKVENERATFGINVLISGIFLALALLYFALFIFYSDKKENLFYALFNLCISVLFAVSMLQRLVKSDLDLYVFYSTLNSASLTLVFIFYLGFLYSIFYAKIPKLFYIISAVAIAFVASDLIGFNKDLLDKFQLGFIVLTTFVGLFIIIRAIMKKKDNAWIIGTGVILFVLFVIALFITGILGLNINSLVGIILFFIGLISLPMSMSIYLARNIATTNKNLQKQLITVKELSEKELEQKLRAQKAEAENERKTKELEEARQLQLSMLPRELPVISNLDIAVYMKTATEVGGDYYDFHVRLDGTLTVILGDATGHGMMSGMMVSIMKSLFMSDRTNKELKPFFENANAAIKDMQLGRLMMALTCVQIYDNKIITSNAGMPPLFIYRKNSQSIEEVVINNMPLGAMKGSIYDIKELEINKGDTLLLMSDGFAELKNDSEEIFGYKRARDNFEEVARKEPEEIVHYLIDEGSRWTNYKEPEDDVTFVVIKVK